MHLYFREAWKSLENKTREEAMKEYISKVTLTVPDWNLVGVLYVDWKIYQGQLEVTSCQITCTMWIQ